jgi:hypothetical protein
VTPYYSDDLVTIYHGDARDGTPDADVLVTDPPYGTGAYATDTNALTPDLLRSWVERYTSVAVFGWPERLTALLIQAQTPPREWIVWWPTNAELKGRFQQVPVARDSEHIALFGRLREARGAPVAPGRHHYVSPNDRAKHHISPKGKRWGDVWRDASPGIAFGQPGRRLHPNQKPVPLMTRLLDVVAEGTVLDPFMGSGTTLLAARGVGRKAIGIEIDERHCETAARRLSQDSQDTLGLTA